MRRLRSLLFAAALALPALIPAGSALALSYPVTSLSDEDAKGTLRASIKEANAHTGADTIPIEVTGTITLGSALPPIGDVTISGPGAGSLTVARDESAPEFSVLEFAGTATVSGITVRGGLYYKGAGIFNGSTGDLTLLRVVVTDNEAQGKVSGVAAVARGAGIFSRGSLTLRESVVSGNRAIATELEGAVAAGGGINTEGTLFVERSTISGNVAEGKGEGFVVTAEGGGVLAEAQATVVNSTISGNVADASGAAAQIRAQGGGIQTYDATITASTIAGNTATSAGLALGANIHSLLSTTVRDTLIAEPLGGANNCSGGLAPGSEEFTSGGYNLDEDGSCELGASSDLVGVVAGIDPLLRDNGGPTPTHALLEGSIAIDRGNSFGLTVDQRGLPRPSDFPAISDKGGGDGSDIGAFELQAPPPGPEPVRVTAAPGDTTPPNTRIVIGPPRNTYKREAKFRVASSEPQSTFQCRLDGKLWYRCASLSWRTVKPGKHVFKVRAIDRFGNVDPTPARFGWRVKRISGRAGPAASRAS